MAIATVTANNTQTATQAAPATYQSMKKDVLNYVLSLRDISVAKPTNDSNLLSRALSDIRQTHYGAMIANALPNNGFLDGFMATPNIVAALYNGEIDGEAVSFSREEANRIADIVASTRLEYANDSNWLNYIPVFFECLAAADFSHFFDLYDAANEKDIAWSVHRKMNEAGFGSHACELVSGVDDQAMWKAQPALTKSYEVRKIIQEKINLHPDNADMSGSYMLGAGLFTYVTATGAIYTGAAITKTVTATRKLVSATAEAADAAATTAKGGQVRPVATVKSPPAGAYDDTMRILRIANGLDPIEDVTQGTLTAAQQAGVKVGKVARILQLGGKLIAPAGMAIDGLNGGIKSYENIQREDWKSLTAEVVLTSAEVGSMLLTFFTFGKGSAAYVGVQSLRAIAQEQGLNVSGGLWELLETPLERDPDLRKLTWNEIINAQEGDEIYSHFEAKGLTDKEIKTLKSYAQRQMHKQGSAIIASIDFGGVDMSIVSEKLQIDGRDTPFILMPRRYASLQYVLKDLQTKGPLYRRLKYDDKDDEAINIIIDDIQDQISHIRLGPDTYYVSKNPEVSRIFNTKHPIRFSIPTAQEWEIQEKLMKLAEQTGRAIEALPVTDSQEHSSLETNKTVKLAISKVRDTHLGTNLDAVDASEADTHIPGETPAQITFMASKPATVASFPVG